MIKSTFIVLWLLCIVLVIPVYSMGEKVIANKSVTNDPIVELKSNKIVPVDYVWISYGWFG